MRFPYVLEGALHGARITRWGQTAYVQLLQHPPQFRISPPVRLSMHPEDAAKAVPLPDVVILESVFIFRTLALAGVSRVWMPSMEDILAADWGWWSA